MIVSPADFDTLEPQGQVPLPAYRGEKGKLSQVTLSLTADGNIHDGTFALVPHGSSWEERMRGFHLRAEFTRSLPFYPGQYIPWKPMERSSPRYDTPVYVPLPISSCALYLQTKARLVRETRRAAWANWQAMDEEHRRLFLDTFRELRCEWLRTWTRVQEEVIRSAATLKKKE